MKFAVVFLLSLVNAQDKIFSTVDPEVEYIGGGGEAGRDKADQDFQGIALMCLMKVMAASPPPEQGPGSAPPPEQSGFEAGEDQAAAAAAAAAAAGASDVTMYEMECGTSNCFAEEAEKVDLWSKFKYPMEKCTMIHTKHHTLETQHPDLKCHPAPCSAAFFMKPVTSIFVLILLLF